MVFSAPVFLYAFLPVFLAVYYVIPARYRVTWMLAGSWIFYGFWRPDFLPLLVLVSLGNWAAGSMIHRLKPDRPGAARLAIGVAVAIDLAVLGYFKYFNFGVDSLNAALGLAGLPAAKAWKVVLPVGISFYVFQAMSYAVDVYRGDAPPATSFAGMAAYIALFPQLVAGPIVRYKDLAEQLDAPDLGADGMAYGVRRFVAGLCRKVLVADSVAPIANAAFALADPSAADAWLGVLAYSVQLYFDFSGYSDMAVGLGRMLGLSFMENFDAPYRASSITEFWRRWHISLSTWLRDYLYVPLGGNRKGPARTYLNLALVMVLGGLWHGASWNFAAWGAWHGAWLAAERLAAAHSSKKPGAASTRGAAAAARIALTQMAVALGWVLFRAPNFPTAANMLTAMAGLGGAAASADMAWRYGGLELAALAAGLALITVERRASDRTFEAEKAREAEAGSAAAPRPAAAFWRALVPLATAAGLAAAAVKLSADSFSPFLYFQF